jgi:hypothetical protein
LTDPECGSLARLAGLASRSCTRLSSGSRQHWQICGAWLLSPRGNISVSTGRWRAVKTRVFRCELGHCCAGPTVQDGGTDLKNTMCATRGPTHRLTQPGIGVVAHIPLIAAPKLSPIASRSVASPWPVVWSGVLGLLFSQVGWGIDRGCEQRGVNADHRARLNPTTTSIKWGPRFCIALWNWAANSSTNIARLDSTPMPEASFTQFRTGLCRSSIENALRPGSPAPTRVSSMFRIA